MIGNSPQPSTRDGTEALDPLRRLNEGAKEAMALFELRMILFSTEETMKALATFIRISGRTLPRGTFVRIDHHPARRDFAQLIFVTDDGETMRFPLSETEMAASLLNECIARKIMLPRMAGKQVRVLDDQFALVLDVGTNPPSRTFPPERPRGPPARPPTARTPVDA
jgi:hypothetical protein